MIQFENLSLRRGQKLLFNNANLQIQPGDRIGIVGRNGCGKSSTFGLLLGELTPDSGNLSIPKNWQLAIMRQQVTESRRNAIDYVLDGDTKLRHWQQALKKAEQEDDHQMITTALGELDTLQAYSANARAEQLLTGLGFKHDDSEKQVKSFSGGWRIRLNLAQALMSRSDLLLLDEPTNHLDLGAVTWLENWLNRYEGTLLIISHDRDFLDEVTKRTLHFSQGALDVYQGSYSAAERQKAERMAQQQAMHAKQQQRIAEIEDFVRRFRAKATKAKQAQSRLKELERMQRVEAAHVDTPFHFRIEAKLPLPNPMLRIDHGELGYQIANPILKGVKFSIQPGDRIGLLGANGAGKSTLLKTLSAQVDTLQGELWRSDQLKIGYFAQHQLEALDENASPILQLQRLKPDAREQDIRNFLGNFDFGDNADIERIDHFSGGEKARLALAIIAWQNPHLLILDEPTNHLDLDMCHALTLALQHFEGALLLVSHDKHLLRHCVDNFWLVHDGKLTDFDGDLTDYQRLISSPLQQTPPSKMAQNQSDNSHGNTDSKKEKRQQAAAQREKLKPLRNALKKTERELDNINQQLAQIEAQLTDESLYQAENSQILQDLLKQQGQLKNQQEAVELRWFELEEELDQFS